MQVRTAEVVAVLSLATDLATRAPFEHGLRSTWYAMRLAEQFALDADEARRTYYLTALAGAGEASTDLAVLVDVPSASRSLSERMPERIAAIARELDAERSRHTPQVAHSLLRGRPRRPVERRIASAAMALDPPDGPLWDAMLDDEPRPHRHLEPADIDSALSALGVFGSLVSPYFRGHSAAVSALATLVAQQRGLSEEQVTVVRRAGLLHDLRRAGVPREVWERPGVFGPDDWAEVRAGVAAAEGLLNRVPWLARLGDAVGSQSSQAALILAAADAYCAMVADRPHRPAMSSAAAALALRADAVAGRFDADVVESVLRAAGTVARTTARN
jgi:HD-GYP domain-containing protein (c-di-GMP phosphodiesterase class II)